jgi:hypothetical protein
VHAPNITVKPVPLVLLGVLGGVFVGMTSVGSGSIIVVALLMMYPALKASQLVGTDLVQAVPLVAAAAAAHVINGDANFAVAGSLLIGAIPGAIIGAQISSRAPGGIIRRALAILLVASGLKSLDAPTPVVIGAALAMLVLGNLVWITVRRRTRIRAEAKRSQLAEQAPASGADVGALPAPSPATGGDLPGA